MLIAAEGKHAALLAQEFPQLTILPLAGYKITYAKRGVFFGLKIVQQIPKIYRAVANEQAWLRKTVKEHGIDAVISDNRFGLSLPDLPCVFISHQLLIKTPFGGITERILKKINFFYIRKYTECWVPDFKDEPNLSGELAHLEDMPGNVTYLGCLSRFEKKPNVTQKYDLLVLISGPEPQRTRLEELIISQIKPLPVKALIVSGKPDQAFRNEIATGITHVSHLNAKELNDAVLASGLVLCRSGYTTLMDLAKLDKKAILVPTPGQTEQEYLGKWLMDKGYFYNVPQHQFDLAKALKASKNFPFRSFSQEQDMNAYKAVVRRFVDSLHAKEKVLAAV
ncbi:glycosyl transferase family 28 [Chitinophaga horti]|uniref:Glycosyl transferase family 28 n=1 Tax=Chitinophaga horti TaxID=2920382 RepID=A0ABY6J024_9BACT|nr:glycosyltransferase [Chitinophaga horti]UYQ92893.1 glycosyl transferase family 28 [Chitinophaga horti]